MSDRIALTIPTLHGYRAVASLVLGGVGTRVGLPYERMDDLQLAVLSVLDSATEESVTLEIEVEGGQVAVALGPVAEGVASDRAIASVLERLVDDVEETRRDGRAWLGLRRSQPR